MTSIQTTKQTSKYCKWLSAWKWGLAIHFIDYRRIVNYMHGKNNMNENSLIESLETVQHCLDINFTSFEKLMLYFTDDKEFLKFIWNFKLKFGIILKWERVLRFKHLCWKCLYIYGTETKWIRNCRSWFIPITWSS